MTMGVLRDTLRAQPFRPFVIHLANGRTHKIRHPDFVNAEKDGRTFTVVGPDGVSHVVDLYLVAELEIQTVAPEEL